MSSAGSGAGAPSAPPSRVRLLGAVLAGGVGRRYGGPKEGVEVAGVSMLERTVGVLREVTGKVVVVASRPVETPDGVEVIPDRVEGRGPLGGLHAALRRAEEEGLDGVFLVACDLPLMEASVVWEVAGAVADAPAVAPEGRSEGWIEPLCAVWTLEALPEVERRLDGDDRSLHGLFRAVGGRTLQLQGGGARRGALLNVNTPADRRRAERALADEKQADEVPAHEAPADEARGTDPAARDAPAGEDSA